MTKTFLAAAILAGLLHPLHANPISRRATITGSGGNGRCTVEVNVDGMAEVEISGDTGILTTISGQPAVWRRFQCNAPLPRNPVNFRFVKTAGRGSARLVQDPRGSGGRVVVQIGDNKGGRGGYTFDLRWHGSRSGGWNPGPPGPPAGDDTGGFPVKRAIRACQDSVTSRLQRDGYSDIAFERTVPDNNPGRNDWVLGTASASRGHGTRRFSFSCSVDFSSGRVRSADVQRR